MLDNYKRTLCNRYSTPGGCHFGARCSFAHGPHELRAAAPAVRPATDPHISHSLEGAITAAAVDLLQAAGGSLRLTSLFGSLYGVRADAKEFVASRRGPKAWAAATFRHDFSQGPGYESVRLPTNEEYTNDLAAALRRHGGQAHISFLYKGHVPPPANVTYVKDVLEANSPDRFFLESLAPNETGFRVYMVTNEESPQPAPAEYVDDPAAFPNLSDQPPERQADAARDDHAPDEAQRQRVLERVQGVARTESPSVMLSQEETLTPAVSALFISAPAPEPATLQPPTIQPTMAPTMAPTRLEKLSPQQVQDLLSILGFSQYKAGFDRWQVSGVDLAEEGLCDEHLNEIGVGLGLHRLRLLRLLKVYRESGVPDEVSPTDDLCVVCLEHPKTFVLIGCGHKILCDLCAGSLESARERNGSAKCPMCRGEVRGVQRVVEVA